MTRALWSSMPSSVLGTGPSGTEGVGVQRIVDDAGTAFGRDGFGKSAG